jgi:murein DD-endopeptidase MepM/ murein hydrolase activator NlpD
MLLPAILQPELNNLISRKGDDDMYLTVRLWKCVGISMYRFPFPSGTPAQKHFSLESHIGRDKHAIDFLISEGTDICAPREGKILLIKDDSEKGGPHPSFANDANYVVIGHNDGERSLLIHLQKGSVRVRTGDTVSVGQVIARQGSTGWTTQPHVHFAVYRNGITIPIRFEKSLRNH